MKFNTNSNTYIIIYSVVMVVVVAVLLSVAALGLKPRQEANMLNEKKTQIVKALGEDPATVAYDSVITKAVILDASGAVVSEDVNEVFAALNDLNGSFAAQRYPIFVATSGVVVPLYGAGLWGPIWGYIALDADMNTVKGIVLDHSGETPGLGAEITTPKHQAMYPGKTIYEGDAIVGVTLKKGGADKSNPHEVDAITGGTKTSDGVTAMISDCLNYYKPYFDAARAAAVATVEAESNTINE
ncbi:MAG: NADH:ubiquinone reductase (Na(+)-transporting) subunit C [Alistipes sp.]|jgi:Na+-transporting NADH:ubiquinone oxidoreductase subunit C|nr:NADH:ubiquinone reductase (Na(+)-transporting) subunit C [Alistipes sp.]